MYAVIRTGGKQYRVAPGDVIRVESLQATGSDGARRVFVDHVRRALRLRLHYDAASAGPVCGDRRDDRRDGAETP